MANRLLPFPTLVLISLCGISFAAAQNPPEQPAPSNPPPVDQAAPASDPAAPTPTTAEPTPPPVAPNSTPGAPPREPAPPSQPPPPTTPAPETAPPGAAPPTQPRPPAAPTTPRRPPVRKSASDRAVVPLNAVVHKPVGIYDARQLVLAGNVPVAKKVLDTLNTRYPADARVPYLRYIMQYQAGRPKEALSSLEHAVALEYYRPVGDYRRFMEPIQGAARSYAERVRTSLDRLDSLGKLEVPPFEEVIAPPSQEASQPGKNHEPSPETETE